MWKEDRTWKTETNMKRMSYNCTSTLKKYVVRPWRRCDLLRTDSRSWLILIRQLNIGFYKTRAICWVVQKPLGSEEGLFYVELHYWDQGKKSCEWRDDSIRSLPQSAYCCIPLQPFLAHVNKPKGFVANEECLVWFQASAVVWDLHSSGILHSVDWYFLIFRPSESTSIFTFLRIFIL
jgi:hypothetical protein